MEAAEAARVVVAARDAVAVAEAARGAVVVWAVAGEPAPVVIVSALHAAKLFRMSGACPVIRSNALNAVR